MEKIVILVLALSVLFLWMIFRKEKYTAYENMYQAYTVPYQDMSFISAGERPVLGHYLRLYDDGGLSPLRTQYIDQELKQDPCNRCMVHCLNPTTLIYQDEALGLCKQFCEEQCKNANWDVIRDAFMESKYQLQHNKTHEHYQNIPTSYYDQGAWVDYPSWFPSS